MQIDILKPFPIKWNQQWDELSSKILHKSIHLIIIAWSSNKKQTFYEVDPDSWKVTFK